MSEVMERQAAGSLCSQADAAADAARIYLRRVKAACLARVAPQGRVDPALVEAEQRQVHGFAWVATTVEGLTQLAAWASRLDAAGRLGEGERHVLQVGVYAMEPEADALGDYLRSLDALTRTISTDVLVLPGHGLPFTGLHARAEALMQHHEGRCSLIRAACRGEPQSAASLVPVVFPRVLDAHQTGFAFVEVLAHVNYMLSCGELHAINKGVRQRYRTTQV